jgi:hypothetical protein
MFLDDGHATGYQLALSGRGPRMSDVFDSDDTIDRQASSAELARVATVKVFGTAMFAGKLLRLDQKLANGTPKNPPAHGERAQHQAGTVADLENLSRR